MIVAVQAQRPQRTTSASFAKSQPATRAGLVVGRFARCAMLSIRTMGVTGHYELLMLVGEAQDELSCSVLNSWLRAKILRHGPPMVVSPK